MAELLLPAVTTMMSRRGGAEGPRAEAACASLLSLLAKLVVNLDDTWLYSAVSQLPPLFRTLNSNANRAALALMFARCVRHCVDGDRCGRLIRRLCVRVRL